jgi:hypothetical protein
VNRFTLGLDLGQVSDPSAISILDEQVETRTIQGPADALLGAPGSRIITRNYLLRQLERPALGTSYPDIVREVKTFCEHQVLRDQTDIVVDATGVGRPVIDVMRENGLNPIPVVITFGNAGKDVIMDPDGYFRVPKVDIMASLQVLFGSGRLKYPAELLDVDGVNLVPVWLMEMERFKMKQTKSGNMTYEAWRETDHDDIVLAIALPCWWVLYSRPKVEIVDQSLPPEEEYNPHSVLRRVRERR